MEHWRRLTIQAAKREARYHRLFRRFHGKMPLDSRGRWSQSRWKRWRKRCDNVERQYKALRQQAAVAAYNAGVSGVEWRKVWKPIACPIDLFPTMEEWIRNPK